MLKYEVALAIEKYVRLLALAYKCFKIKAVEVPKN